MHDNELIEIIDDSNSKQTDEPEIVFDKYEVGESDDSLPDLKNISYNTANAKKRKSVEVIHLLSSDSSNSTNINLIETPSKAVKKFKKNEVALEHTDPINRSQANLDIGTDECNLSQNQELGNIF